MQLKLVDAAHIIPVSFQFSTDDTSNGIALCALHHRAYDLSLVTFNTNYQVMLNQSQLKDFTRMNLDGGLERFVAALRPIIHMPPVVLDRPASRYVERANELRGWTHADIVFRVEQYLCQASGGLEVLRSMNSA
jgi:putative restriction endonuclease